MAKRLKPEGAPSSEGVNPVDLKRAIAEVSRLKANASEASGQVGAMTNSFVERHGLEKTAFTFVRRLNDMEEGKRASVLRSLIEYSHKMGMFAQVDAFDPFTDVLKKILADIESNDNSAKQTEGKAVVEALLN